MRLYVYLCIIYCITFRKQGHYSLCSVSLFSNIERTFAHIRGDVVCSLRWRNLNMTWALLLLEIIIWSVDRSRTVLSQPMSDLLVLFWRFLLHQLLWWGSVQVLYHWIGEFKLASIRSRHLFQMPCSCAVDWLFLLSCFISMVSVYEGVLFCVPVLITSLQFVICYSIVCNPCQNLSSIRHVYYNKLSV